MTSSAAMPMRISSRWLSPGREATTTCLGSRPGRRPSVMAMSIKGTMTPRRLKIPSKYAGPSGSLVSSGQSRTSSTSSTGRQKRSRPLRNTQNCDSGERSSMGPSASSRSTASASAGRGSRWKSSLILSSISGKCSCEPPNRAKQFVARKWLGDVAVGALLFAPELVAHGILGSHHDHGDGIKLGIPFEIPADLVSVAVRHNNIEQDHARPFGRDRFLHKLGVVQAHGPVTFLLQKVL